MGRVQPQPTNPQTIQQTGQYLNNTVYVDEAGRQFNNAGYLSPQRTPETAGQAGQYFYETAQYNTGNQRPPQNPNPTTNVSLYDGTQIERSNQPQVWNVDIDRRLDEYSARVLARLVFSKYDANGSGYINSQECAQLVEDLYASINDVNYTAERSEGLDFMNANDIDNDQTFSLDDFENIFVRHLSTSNHTGFRLFYE